MFPFSKYVSICSVLGIQQALFNIRGHQYVRTYPVWYKRQYAELLLLMLCHHYRYRSHHNHDSHRTTSNVLLLLSQQQQYQLS